MPDNEFSDTQKEDFFKQCENLTFFEVLIIKAYGKFFRLRDFFQSLKTKFWVA